MWPNTFLTQFPGFREPKKVEKHWSILRNVLLSKVLQSHFRSSVGHLFDLSYHTLLRDKVFVYFWINYDTLTPTWIFFIFTNLILFYRNQSNQTFFLHVKIYPLLAINSHCCSVSQSVCATTEHERSEICQSFKYPKKHVKNSNIFIILSFLCF